MHIACVVAYLYTNIYACTTLCYMKVASVASLYTSSFLLDTVR